MEQRAQGSSQQRSQGQQRPQPRPRQMPGDIVKGTFRDARSITEALQAAQERFHLVSAGTSTAVPEGVAVAFSPILIDVEAETYKVAGGYGNEPRARTTPTSRSSSTSPVVATSTTEKRGLAKVALDRIAAAAGISWDPTLTKRIDSGSHPYFVHYQAVGFVRDFDGSRRVVKGDKIVDMREGSPALENYVVVSASKIARESKGSRNAHDPDVLREAREKAEGQIRAVRHFILEHAESKAKNRAIRSLGVRTSYQLADLAKPFVIARPVFTGDSSDPEIRRENAAAIRNAFLNADSALYGPATPMLPAPTATYAPPPPSARPPVEARIVESDEWPLGDDDGEVGTERQQEPEHREQRATQQQSGEATPAPREQSAPRGDGPEPRKVFQFGNDKGNAIAEADDEQIEWYAGALEKSISDPSKEKYRAQNEADLAYCNLVLSRRSGEDTRY